MVNFLKERLLLEELALANFSLKKKFRRRHLDLVVAVFSFVPSVRACSRSTFSASRALTSTSAADTTSASVSRYFPRFVAADAESSLAPIGSCCSRSNRLLCTSCASSSMRLCGRPASWAATSAASAFLQRLRLAFASASAGCRARLTRRHSLWCRLCTWKRLVGFSSDHGVFLLSLFRRVCRWHGPKSRICRTAWWRIRPRRALLCCRRSRSAA